MAWVIIRKTHLFAGILACSPFMPMLGTATGFPTHVGLLWYAAVLALFVLLIPLRKSFLMGLANRAFIPALYVFTFIVVSYFGANFAESQKYRVLWLPLMLIDFMAWYCVGYYVKERLFMRYFTVATCVFGLVSIIIAELTYQERILSGPDVAFAIGPAVMLSSKTMAVMLMLLSMASLKKTIVVCSGAALVYAYVFNKFSRYRWPKEPSRFRVIGIPPVIKWIAGSLITLAALLWLGFQIAPHMEATFTRIASEGGEDALRLIAIVHFVDLLPQYFPQGSGYYTFGFLTADFIEFTTVTNSGDILYGMSLHNSYMHFLLEGGLVIVLIVFVMYWAYFRTIRRLRQWPDAFPLSRILMSWMIVAVIFGMLNQFHATQYFLGMFGYASGCLERYRSGNLV